MSAPTPLPLPIIVDILQEHEAPGRWAGVLCEEARTASDT